ncbi:hypothetical protein [Ruegeria sp. HKCCD8929]|uniref:hypothetical protein n=1 Tax=Ruegeria sp. HKCCD8929 TaxID=2683006 RepID=UPI0014881C02|nr:hypothetical protein [Ruegeria sp. HKCCD8929]
MSGQTATVPSQTLPATPKQLAYARRISQERNVVLPWEIQQDRYELSRWIDAQLQAPAADKDPRPSSKQVAFAERIARIKRSVVPDECFRDRVLMSRWIDSNKP